MIKLMSVGDMLVRNTLGHVSDLAIEFKVLVIRKKTLEVVKKRLMGIFLSTWGSRRGLYWYDAAGERSRVRFGDRI